MARPKAFDRDEALAAAIGHFCDHGYEGASTASLLEAMGISRQSLYDTFGDKRRLYLEALQRYVAESVADQIRTLNGAPSPLKGVVAVLRAQAAKAEAEGRRGCMGVGAVCEFGRSDPEINLMTEAADRALGSALERRFAEARAAGEVGADLDPRAATEFVGATLAGIKLAARAGAPPRTLRNIAEMAIRSLR